MKILQKTYLFIFMAVLVLFDVTFLANLTIFNANLLLSFSVLLIVALLVKSDDYLILAISASFFLAILSSLPIILIMFNYVIIPAVIFGLRQRFFPRPTIASSFFYFIAAFFLFQLSLVVYIRIFNHQVLVSSVLFIFLNSVLGCVIFAIAQSQYRKRSLTNDSIKIS